MHLLACSWLVINTKINYLCRIAWCIVSFVSLIEEAEKIKALAFCIAFRPFQQCSTLGMQHLTLVYTTTLHYTCLDPLPYLTDKTEKVKVLSLWRTACR